MPGHFESKQSYPGGPYTQVWVEDPASPSPQDQAAGGPVTRTHNADGTVTTTGDVPARTGAGGATTISGGSGPRDPLFDAVPAGTPVDQSQFTLPNADQIQADLRARQAAIAARQGPAQLQAAQVAPVSQAQAAQAQQAQLAALVQAGRAAQAQAGQAGAVSIGPAAQAADSAFRANQAALVDQLNRYATGQESVSQLQLRQNAEAALAQQQAMAASARPGQGGLAARIAAQNAGAINTNLMSQAAIAGLQERQANAAQLQQLLGTARGQDLSLSQFNAGQSNQQAQAQGQLAAQIGIANAGNTTQAGISNAQMTNQQALANMQAANAYNLSGAQLAQQGQQFNAQQLQQMALANAQAQNARAAQQAQLEQQAGQFGVSAGLQFQGQQDAATQQALAQQMALAAQQQQGNIAYGTLAQQQAFQQQQLRQQQALAELAAQTQMQLADKSQPGFWDYFTKVAAPIGAAIATG